MPEKLFRIFEDPIVGKQGKADPGIKSRIHRIVLRSPEVMVKISGHAKGSAHLKSHLEYISRNGELPLETEMGEVISGREDVLSLHQDWASDLGIQRSFTNKEGKKIQVTRDSTNIVLSMPPGTDPSKVLAASREFANKTFGDNHQYVLVMHTDEKHPHVHLTVKNFGFDGLRLHVKKGDPQLWRESFASKLRGQGIDAEATPRATRGVVRRSLNQAVIQMKERGIRPRVESLRVKQVIEEAKAEKEGKVFDRPWEENIKQRQIQVRKAWLATAEQFKESDNQEDRGLADKITSFVKSMPGIDTERHRILSRVQKEKRQEPDAPER